MRSRHATKKITFIRRYTSHKSKWRGGGLPVNATDHTITFRWNESDAERWCQSCGKPITPGTLHWRGVSVSSDALCTDDMCGGE